VHFVSSDGHNTTRRPVKLKFALESIAQEFGQGVAQALVVDNPAAAFNGEPLPYVPEVAASAERPKRKRFFFF